MSSADETPSTTDILAVADAPHKENKLPLSGAEFSLFEKLCERAGVPRPPLIPSWETPPPKYIRPSPDVETYRANLFKEIEKRAPKIVLALGAAAAYLLTGDQKIKDSRGYLTEANGVKILPTYHPRTVLTDYGLRLPCIFDLRKLARHANSRPISRPDRRVHIVEVLEDVRRTHDLLLATGSDLTVDIETHIDIQQISTISFSHCPQEAYVIPLLRWAPLRSVWTEEEETIIFAWIAKILAFPVRHIFHHAAFDLSHLHNYGIHATGVDDTMLMAHSQQPEMSKSLGFLASLVSEERQWKKMRTRAKDEEKAEE